MFHSAVSPLSLLHECLLTAVHGVNPHQAYRLRQTSSMTETSSALQRSHQNLPNHQICPQSRQVPVTSVYCMVAIWQSIWQSTMCALQDQFVIVWAAFTIDQQFYTVCTWCELV